MKPAAALLAVLWLSGSAFAQTPSPDGHATVAQRVAARLQAADLKADVSFLASDALQGRATPSPGLDAAAEYIASRFRRAGLEPAGDDGYFQTGTYHLLMPNPDGLTLTLGGTKAVPGTIAIAAPAPTDLKAAPAYKLSQADAAAVDTLTADQIRGKVVFVEMSGFQAQRRIMPALAKLEPALVVTVQAFAQPVNPNARPAMRDATLPGPTVATLTVWDPALREALAAAKSGPLDEVVTAHVAAPRMETVKARNVAGLLRGSDPALQDTYVIVTGHYDHLGVRPGLEGDRIYNGANDDASGTSSVVEIGAALASLQEKPRRSILFMTVYGEEIGGYGSRYYTSHPIFPLAKTVADINLEQLGRTDDLEGPRPLQFNLTGFDYTDIAAVMARAGAETGIQVIKHETNSDAFFARSDNAAFAEAGIPSTTISVAYVFPDYHKVSDEWQNLDYDNMAKVDVCIALGIWNIAGSEKAPEWNRENPRTARYVEAREKQR